MKINQWLYADPTDGPSTSIIPILVKQFPDAVLCTSFDQLRRSIKTEGKHTVLILPQLGAPDRKLSKSIRKG